MSPAPTGPINIVISPPVQAIPGGTALGTILSNAIAIIFTAAVLVVLVMLIIGAFQWILSGGDKDAVGNARKRITHALIGLGILALAFLIATVAGQILGFNIFNLQIPTLPQR